MPHFNNDNVAFLFRVIKQITFLLIKKRFIIKRFSLFTYISQYTITRLAFHLVKKDYIDVHALN